MDSLLLREFRLLVINALGQPSVNTIGPKVFDTHPLSVTVIFVYVPAVRLLINIAPDVEDVLETGAMGTPFFE